MESQIVASKMRVQFTDVATNFNLNKSIHPLKLTPPHQHACFIHFLRIIYMPYSLSHYCLHTCMHTHTHTHTHTYAASLTQHRCGAERPSSGLMIRRSSCAYCISSWNRHITKTGKQYEQLSRFLSKSFPTQWGAGMSFLQKQYSLPPLAPSFRGLLYPL